MLLAVFGATGQQGGSLIDYVLADPQLSKEYTLRAITRDPSSAKGVELGKKVEVARGDASDPASLTAALDGVHTVFAMTAPDFGPDGLEIELRQGKAIADAAVNVGAKYIIFSTLPSASKISGGRFTRITHYEAKAQVEEYIRGLPIKSAFFAPGFFMQNFETMRMFQPRKVIGDDDVWEFAMPNESTATLPMIDVVADTGKFVGAILAQPDKYEGQTFAAGVGRYSFAEMAEHLSRGTGKKVVYKKISVEEWMQPYSETVARAFLDQPGYIQEFEIHGSDSEELVAWARSQARGKLTTFEEFLSRHKLQLID